MILRDFFKTLAHPNSKHKQVKMLKVRLKLVQKPLAY